MQAIPVVSDQSIHQQIYTMASYVLKVCTYYIISFSNRQENKVHHVLVHVLMLYGH